jgi:hypothetical protein
MTDNRAQYGIRLYRHLTGDPHPVEEMIVATAQSFDVYGAAQNVKLGPGDPVIKLAGGGVNLCPGNETTTETPYGIVLGVAPYYNAVTGRMEFLDGLPADVAWGTNLERQSKVYVLPVDKAIWEVDVDDAVTATTLAAYQALIGSHADHILTGAVGETRADPKLDISTVETTSTLMWNIVGISDSLYNKDFSGANVKLLVKSNVMQLKTAGMTGI